MLNITSTKTIIDSKIPPTSSLHSSPSKRARFLLDSAEDFPKKMLPETTSPSTSAKNFFKNLPFDRSKESATAAARTVFDQIPAPLTSHSSILSGFSTPTFYGSPTVSPKASNRKVPPTPYITRPINTTFAINAKSAQESLEIIRTNGTFSLNCLHGKCGAHSQLYSLNHSMVSVVEGVPNEDIFIKIFKRDLIEKLGDAIYSRLFNTSMKQYDELLSCEVPIAKIYNRTTAHVDGYLIVEKVSPIIFTWDSHTTKLSVEQIELLDKICNFFIYGLQSPSCIPLDLSTENFGINDKNDLVLLDFMEEDEPQQYAFRIHAKSAAEKISKGSSLIYNYIREKIKPVEETIYVMMGESDLDTV